MRCKLIYDIGLPGRRMTCMCFLLRSKASWVASVSVTVGLFLLRVVIFLSLNFESELWDDFKTISLHWSIFTAVRTWSPHSRQGTGQLSTSATHAYIGTVVSFRVLSRPTRSLSRRLRPASPSEHLFSAAGQIYSDRYSNLVGENAEKLLFLAYNIRLFNFNYWTLQSTTK